MEEKLDKLYNEIVNRVVSIIPSKWEKIYFMGEVEKEKKSWNFIFYFLDEDNKFQRAYEIPELYKVSEEIFDNLMEEVEETLLRIYDCFIENNQESWTRMVFKLSKRGKFTIDFSYNNEFDKFGPAERETLWAYKTFGYVPKSKFLRAFLENRN